MKKWPKRSFFPEENNECLPNFEVFNENEFLETEQKRQKLTSSPLKKQGPLKKFRPRNLTIFHVICLSKSGNGTHLFSGAVFNKCIIAVSQKSPPLSLPNPATRSH